MVASRRPAGARTGSARFNPLHCGAVVASGSVYERWVDEAGSVSIPFIAGQWSLPGGGASGSPPPRLVSIPFIAGQWSLQPRAQERAQREVAFQSPSLRGSGRFRCAGRRPLRRMRVSIPFIAGQWSLPDERAVGGDGGAEFQSPSLRGSGRFPTAQGSPSRRRQVSIPFIAGQWSLLLDGSPDTTRAALFQSPSLRGSGRFAMRL